MRKIMFSDAYQLTQAVLDGRKTQTRRIITCPKTFKGEVIAGFHVYRRMSDNAILEYPIMYDADERDFDGGVILPRYNVGEVVSVAQSYKNCGYNANALDRSPKDLNVVRGTLGESKGWNNKMFVRADACKYRIRITDVRVERLNDISESDCIAEGIYLHTDGYYSFPNSKKGYDTPREAYAALIDKTSGRGTWDSNPYVFAYTFELAK